MSYNTKLVAFIACFIAAFVSLQAQAFYAAIPLSIAGIALFVSLLFAQRKMNKDNSDVINQKYAAFTKALADTHVYAIRKLAGADDETIAPIVAKLIEAGSHVGSNPAWRSTQRIVGAGDVAAWYDAGKALVDEARAMIDSYVPRKGGIEGTLL